MKTYFKYVSPIIRIILTVILIILIYKETGLCTALGFFLIFIHCELIQIVIKPLIKSRDS